MTGTSSGPHDPARRVARTKQMNIRMDTDLWRRLELAAEADRRTTAGMLHKFVADGLERWELANEVRAAMAKRERRLADLTPQEVDILIRAYERLIARTQIVQAQQPLMLPSPPHRRRSRPRPKSRKG